jgi:hypothetical protein
MSTTLFEPMPDDLSADQRLHWKRRQLTAENTLEIQAMGGTVANAETLACFRSYVRGEVSLTQAIEQARRQLAQEHHSFRQSLNRRNII